MKFVDILLNHLEIKLNQIDYLQVLHQTKEVTFPKNSIILLEGEQSNQLYFIITGIVRGAYSDENGNEYSKCFSSEKEFFLTEGFRTKSVSSFMIESLTDVNCLEIPYSLIEKLCRKNMEIESTLRQLFSKEVTRIESREKLLLLNNATEKYACFLAMYPELSERLPLKYVASFVGIRPSSLSRIRKELNSTIDIG